MENSVDYLRLSLTDRCNLNCIYCTPLEKDGFLSRSQVLTYEEIAQLAALFVIAGIRTLRLTGGEPLIKKGILNLIKMLKGIKGLEEITMTTNGVYLAGLACEMKESGLDRINISIDTLKKDRFKSITGFDFLEDVWKGVMESLEAGLSPVKLNVIAMKGVNDDEILDFARLTCDYPLAVRFIEFFPTNKRSDRLCGCFMEKETVKRQIEDFFGEIAGTVEVKGKGPAEYYKIKDSPGAIGFIGNREGDLCRQCNRIRVDCAARISPCLFSGHMFDLMPLLRGNMAANEQLIYIKNILKMKGEFNKNKMGNSEGIEMSSIGG